MREGVVPLARIHSVGFKRNKQEKKRPDRTNIIKSTRARTYNTCTSAQHPIRARVLFKICVILFFFVPGEFAIRKLTTTTTTCRFGSVSIRRYFN